MRFETPWILSLLVLVGLLVYLRKRKYRRVSVKFSSVSTLKTLPTSLKRRLSWLPFGLRLACLTLLVLALARPQEGREQVRDISKGVAIEMVVDRSSSMSAEMIYSGKRVTRLDAVKEVFREFVEGKGDLDGRPNDLIGMISFARYADTVCPLTLAHGALAEFLSKTKLVTVREEDGTALGDGIALAAARLHTAEEVLAKQRGGEKDDYQIKSKVIIALTDGQTNAGKRSPMEAANLANEWGIKVYTIGIGGGEGFKRQQGLLGSFLVRMGEGVDKKTLTAIAEKTGGFFRLADDVESLREIYEEIDSLEKTDVESIRYLDYRELFQSLGFLALLCLSLEVILSATIFRRLP